MFGKVIFKKILQKICDGMKKKKTTFSKRSVDLARNGKGLKSQPFRKASDIVSAWIDIKVKWSISDTRKTSREKEPYS